MYLITFELIDNQTVVSFVVSPFDLIDRDSAAPPSLRRRTPAQCGGVWCDSRLNLSTQTTSSFIFEHNILTSSGGY